MTKDRREDWRETIFSCQCDNQNQFLQHTHENVSRWREEVVSTFLHPRSSGTEDIGFLSRSKHGKVIHLHWLWVNLIGKGRHHFIHVEYAGWNQDLNIERSNALSANVCIGNFYTCIMSCASIRCSLTCLTRGVTRVLKSGPSAIVMRWITVKTHEVNCYESKSKKEVASERLGEDN